MTKWFGWILIIKASLFQYNRVSNFHCDVRLPTTLKIMQSRFSTSGVLQELSFKKLFSFVKTDTRGRRPMKSTVMTHYNATLLIALCHTLYSSSSLLFIYWWHIKRPASSGVTKLPILPTLQHFFAKLTSTLQPDLPKATIALRGLCLRLGLGPFCSRLGKVI